MRKLAMSVVALVLTMTCVGCGGGDGQKGDDASKADIADITPKAIALDDLPSGWVEDNSADDDENDPLECLQEAEGVLRADRVGFAEVSYVHGTNVPLLEQSLAQYSSADQAAAALASYDRLLDGCGEFEDTIDGEKVTGQVGKVSLDDVTGADRQANYQLTMETGGFSLSGGILLLQKGEYASLMILMDLGAFDTDQLVELGELALEKV